MGYFLRNYSAEEVSKEQKDHILKELKKYGIWESRVKTSLDESGKYKIEIKEIRASKEKIKIKLDNITDVSLEEYLYENKFQCQDQLWVEKGNITKVGKNIPEFKVLRDYKLILEDEKTAKDIYKILEQYQLNKLQVSYLKNDDTNKIEINLYNISPEDGNIKTYIKAYEDVATLRTFIRNSKFEVQKKEFNNDDYLNNVFKIKVSSKWEAEQLCYAVIKILEDKFNKENFPKELLSAVIIHKSHTEKTLFLGIVNNAVNESVHSMMETYNFELLRKSDIENEGLELDFVKNNIIKAKNRGK